MLQLIISCYNYYKSDFILFQYRTSTSQALKLMVVRFKLLYMDILIEINNFYFAMYNMQEKNV